MPNNEDKGMLEDFILNLIPNSDNLIPIVDKILLDIEEKGLNRYRKIHKSKAKAHTWLAWQETPGIPMGKAISYKYLETDVPQVNLFITWLKLLFE